MQLQNWKMSVRCVGRSGRLFCILVLTLSAAVMIPSAQAAIYDCGLSQYGDRLPQVALETLQEVQRRYGAASGATRDFTSEAYSDGVISATDCASEPVVKIFAGQNAITLKLIALNKSQCQALLDDRTLKRHGIQVSNEDYRTDQPSDCVSYWLTLGKNGFNNLTLVWPRPDSPASPGSNFCQLSETWKTCGTSAGLQAQSCQDAKAKQESAIHEIQRLTEAQHLWEWKTNLFLPPINNLTLSERINYLEDLLSFPIDQRAMNAIDALYRSKRGIYLDPDLLSSQNKKIFNYLAQSIRDYLDNNPQIRQSDFMVTLGNPEDFTELVMKALGRNYVNILIDDALPKNDASAYVDPSNKPYNITIVKRNFDKLNILDKIYVLVEESYHVHQYMLKDEYCSGALPGSNILKLYYINSLYTQPEKIEMNLIKDQISKYQDQIKSYVEVNLLKEKEHYYQLKGNLIPIISSAYHNQPFEINAKFVAAYIVGRALCRKDDQKDPYLVAEWPKLLGYKEFSC